MDLGVIVLLACTGLLVIGAYLDTKARIARIEHKINLLLRHSGIDELKELPLSDRVKGIALDPTRKIEAIKIYREETGAGLAEAKNAIETFINSQ